MAKASGAGAGQAWCHGENGFYGNGRWRILCIARRMSLEKSGHIV